MPSRAALRRLVGPCAAGAVPRGSAPPRVAMRSCVRSCGRAVLRGSVRSCGPVWLCATRRGRAVLRGSVRSCGPARLCAVMRSCAALCGRGPAWVRGATRGRAVPRGSAPQRAGSCRPCGRAATRHLARSCAVPCDPVPPRATPCRPAWSRASCVVPCGQRMAPKTAGPAGWPVPPRAGSSPAHAVGSGRGGSESVVALTCAGLGDPADVAGRRSAERILLPGVVVRG